MSEKKITRNVSNSRSEEGMRRLNVSETNANVMFGAAAAATSTPARRTSSSNGAVSNGGSGGAAAIRDATQL